MSSKFAAVNLQRSIFPALLPYYSAYGNSWLCWRSSQRPKGRNWVGMMQHVHFPCLPFSPRALQDFFWEIVVENEMKLWYLLSCFEFITPLFEKLHIIFHNSHKPKWYKHAALKLMVHWWLIGLLELGTKQECLEKGSRNLLFCTKQYGDSKAWRYMVIFTDNWNTCFLKTVTHTGCLATSKWNTSVWQGLHLLLESFGFSDKVALGGIFLGERVWFF